MTPERYQHVKEVLQAAWELDPKDRETFLSQTCSDLELRSLVSSLLASDQNAACFLETPVVNQALAWVGDPNAAPERYLETSNHEPVIVQSGPDCSASLAGRMLGRYLIVSPVGSGGSGQVYQAKDTHLECKAAVKILSPEYTRDREQVQRFKQEAHLASTLNHPNIITVFDIGEAADLCFIATEFVEGQTLRQRLASAPMPVLEAIEITIQVASALAAAHDAGIVHRDVKPANIMVRRDGYVKVLDFGIAKLIEGNSKFGPAGAPDATPPGWVLGTPRYMSPEQALAQPLDGRTDIFSLGIVLYELVAGHAPGPFNDMADAGLPGMILTDQVHQLRLNAQEAPPELDRIVRKMLEKDRNKRYQTVKELLNDLKNLKLDLELENRSPDKRTQNSRRRLLMVAALAGTAILSAAGARRFFWPGMSPRPSQPAALASIAVLPFVDMSPEKDQEYLSDGLSEELRNGLTGVPGLRVTGRTSSFQFKGKTVDCRTIGKKLNVASILEGSVRKQANRLRVSVQLINAADCFQVWSQTFNEDINDVFAVQEEIAQAVLRASKVGSLAGHTASLPAKTPNAAAHNAYLEGIFLLRRNKDEVERAVQFFEQATALDAAFAPAWAGLSKARIIQSESDYVPREDGFRKARETAERALALDPDLVAAHLDLLEIKMRHDWDFDGAEASYKRSLALAPGSAGVGRAAASVAMLLGRWDEAIGLWRKSIEIDPLEPVSYYLLGLTFYYAGRQDEAEASVVKAMEILPEMEGTHALLGRIRLAQSRLDDALAEIQKEHHPVFLLHGLALVNHALGRDTESNRKLKELISGFQTEAPFQIAEVYGFRGETDRAFEWLDRAYKVRDPGLTELKGDPLLKNLESDARYPALLKRMHLAP